ncbi:MAG: DUF1552 domain-containing protein [Pseudomonadota bacterium]
MMYVAKKHLSRRALLKGASVSLALPFLDAMHPALSAERLTAAAPVRRLGIIYYFGGAADRWRPTGEGSNFTLAPGTAPLERHKSKLLFLSGLSADPDRTKPGVHDRAIASWLTGMEMHRDKIDVGVSMDQLAAVHMGKQTQYSSLEIACEEASAANGTPVYKDAHTRLPFELNPRQIFERLFGDGGKIDPAAIAARNAMDRSTLDMVTARIATLKNRLGPQDRIKLDQYLASIRDVERRIQIAEKTKVADLPQAERPAGVPDNWPDYMKVMFDLQVLAYQADLTRVITFMTAREASLMTFPHLGISMQHHEASHHNYEQEKLDALHKININQSELFAYYLDKMDAVKEANGSMLDNSILFFGSTLSDPSVHSQRDLPVMLAGGAAGNLHTGRHLRYAGDLTPISNMHLTLLDKLGVPTDKLGDSTAPLKLDRLSI